MFKEVSDKIYLDLVKFLEESVDPERVELLKLSVRLLCATYEGEIEMLEETLSAVEETVAELTGSVNHLETLVEDRNKTIEDYAQCQFESEYWSRH